MKKSLLSVFALATMLLATGCSQEEEILGVDSSNYVDASFTINLNEGAQSRTLGDGTQVNQLLYGIFDQNQNAVPVIEKTTDVTADNYIPNYIGKAVITGGTATVKMRLVKGQTYDLVFWAQVKGNTYYTHGDDLKTIGVTYEGYANDEDRDAFFKCREDLTVKDHFTETVELRRPFGQLNAFTAVADYKAAEILLGGSPVTKSELVVSNIPNTLNLLDGSVTGSTKNATFTMNYLPKDAATTSAHETIQVDADNDGTAENYVHLSMNYLLADVKDGANAYLYDVTLKFANESETINEFPVTQIPVQRNYKTNIVGNLLTSQGEFTVVVVPEFEIPDNVIVLWDGTSTEEVTDADNDGIYEIFNAAQLAWVADQVNNQNNTFDGKTVKLMADIDLNNQPWTPIGLAENSAKFTGTFDGNGKTIYNLNIVSVDSRVLINGSYTAAGFFGATTGTIKNFTIDGAIIKHVLGAGSNGTANGIAVVAGSTAYGATIDGVHVKNAKVEGNRYVAGIVGYMDGTVSNCTVDGIELIATPNEVKNGYDNGDKVGGIVGYVNTHGSVHSITNNIVTNFTIKGYRDLGGIVGYARSGMTFTGNKVSKGSVTVDASKSYSSAAGDAGMLIGDNSGNVSLDGNTADENTIEIIDNQEGGTTAYVTSTEELKAAITAGKTTISVAGEVKLDASLTKDNMTFVGADNTAVIDMQGQKITAQNVSFKNLTMKRDNQNYVGIQHSAVEEYENCTIEGTYFIYGTTAKFTNCTFKVTGNYYNVWTYGGQNITFKNCEFYCDGKSILIYNEGNNGSNVTFDGCKLYASTPANDGKAAIEIDSSLLKDNQDYVVTINNTTASGFDLGSVSGNSLWNEKVNSANKTKGNRTIVTVDGNTYADIEHADIFEKAIMMDSKTINLNLLADMSWGKENPFTFGGTNTEAVNIIGIAAADVLPTWTWTSTYMIDMGMTNEAGVLNIQDVNLTTSKESGTWDTYDIMFSSNVNIENVNFQKAVALDNPGKKSVLKNVSINETHDYYALWIVAGGDVTIDGLNVTSAGRGIKIDAEYVSDPKLTNLNVANAKFETKSKAAILVDTPAGANITLSNIDLSNVTADTKNAVWVDEDSAEHFNKVIVNGGTKKKE